MKLLGKIIVILVAALMVAGATLALENSGALSSLTGGGPGGRGERPEGAPTDADSVFAAGERPERGGDFGGEGGREGGWASDLGLIAAVVAGVGLLGWLAGQATTRRKLAKAAMPPAKEEMKLDEKG